MNITLSICLFSDCELKATELLLWSLQKGKRKLTDSVNYAAISKRKGKNIEVLKAIAQNEHMVADHKVRHSALPCFFARRLFTQGKINSLHSY